MATSGYQLLDDDLVERIAGSDEREQASWLVLSQSDEFRGRWSVDSLHPAYLLDLEDEVGHYSTVSPARLGEFLDATRELGYQVAFAEPPEAILGRLARLREPPPFSISSGLAGTVNGLLPWQVVGFNRLICDESLRAGLVVWDTGSGKTVFVAEAILWHRDHGHPFDLALVVVKTINKVDMQRKLLRLAGIESVVVTGDPERRRATYAEVEERLRRGERVVVVLNYEKFRDDEAELSSLVSRRDVLFFWDEMNARLSNRRTRLWRSTKRVLWESHWSEPRTRWARHWELTATPLENDPEDQFNHLLLMWPEVLGRVGEFHQEYVAYMNPLSGRPERWRSLDKLEARLEFMTHRVSVKDPEVARYFPSARETTPVVVEWDPRDRATYDKLVAMLRTRDEEGDEEVNVLAMIQLMQMMCDAPSMVGESARNREAFSALLRAYGEEELGMPSLSGPRGSELAVGLLEGLSGPLDDRTHAKPRMLREILTAKHPDDKVLVYMTWSSYGLEPIGRLLDEWGITYVTFAGTNAQRQAAKDRFRQDPDVKVFLSSDAGSDSIDLPEAPVGVHYNLPWKWRTMQQREGRNRRVDQADGVTYWYSLRMADSVEDRKAEIIEQKRAYHEALYDGQAIDESTSARMTEGELRYVLWGDRGLQLGDAPL